MPVRIVAIIHEYDQFYRRRFWLRRPAYLMADIFEVLRARGCRIDVLNSTSKPSPDADLAVMHVDTTFVPPEYLELGKRFPICVNGLVRDISKSFISDARLLESDAWTGEVIVKTDLNSSGGPELSKNARAVKRGDPPPYPGIADKAAYQVFASRAEMPLDVWQDHTKVVERFMPERLPDGFGMCHYVFCGDYEFCGRFIGTEPMVKSKNVFRYEVIPIPDAIRDRRHALGFDFGKFDFVRHDDRFYLLDANKTVGRIPTTGGASVEGLADGLIGLFASP